MRLSGELTYLWPNFCVLELAPTTAKNWDEKKVLMDASVVMVGEMSEQWILVKRWRLVSDGGKEERLFWMPRYSTMVWSFYIQDQ